MDNSFHDGRSTHFFFLLVLLGFILKLVFSNEIFPEILVYSGDIAFILSIVYSYVFCKINNYDNNIILIVFMLIILYSMSSYMAGSSIVGSIKSSMRIFMPIIVANQIILYRKKFNYSYYVRSISIVVFILLHILLIIGFIFLPPSYNRGVVWSSAYFQGLHSSAYVVLVSYFIFIGLVKNLTGKKYMMETMYLLIIFYYVSELFGVRTSLVSLISFLLLRFIFNIKSMHLFASITFLCIGIILFFLIYSDPFGAGFSEYSRLTSGRLGMYLEKIDQLSRNSTTSWLIGNGYGSDAIETKVWWGVKGAHSDFITIIVENGLVGVFLLFIIIKKTYLNLTCDLSYTFFVKIMFVSFLVSSAFSNGIMVRPVASYVFFLALCFISVPCDMSKNYNRAIT